MRGLWSTSKVTSPGLAEWGKSGREKSARVGGKIPSATPLFAPLPCASYGNDILISDVGGWSGFERPNKAFGDCWQDEGGFPEVARVALKNNSRFAGFEVVLGISDPTIPGVMALLRVKGHLIVLCVIDIEMNVDVERARNVTCRLAHEYCVEDAILLFHVSARRTNPPPDKAFVSLGIQCADASVLYPCRAPESPTLFVGWITRA